MNVSVGGAAGITFLLILANEAVAAAIVRRRDGARAGRCYGPRVHRPHCSIVVVGHTGHGKSTLVAAIATATSALQGSTRAPHDVRVLRCSSALKRFTVLDVPGGRRSLSAAMRGTALADVCVLVVSSTMGPQALTREHLLAALAAGISSFVIVINDFDGDADLLSACELEVRSLLAEHGAAGDDAPIVTGSLRTREGAVAAAVLAAIDALPVVVRDSTASALMVGG